MLIRFSCHSRTSSCSFSCFALQLSKIYHHLYPANSMVTDLNRCYFLSLENPECLSECLLFLCHLLGFLILSPNALNSNFRSHFTPRIDNRILAPIKTLYSVTLMINFCFSFESSCNFFTAVYFCLHFPAHQTQFILSSLLKDIIQIKKKMFS